MKLLRAKCHLKINLPVLVTNVKLDDIVMSADMNWLQKRYSNFKNSVEQVGMIYPIIYTDFKNYWLTEKRWPKNKKGEYLKGYIVHTGNKRVLWAKENGYTHIEGYFVKNKEEQSVIVKKTYISRSSFPMNEKHLNRSYTI